MRVSVVLLLLAAVAFGKEVTLSEAQVHLKAFRTALKQRKLDTKDIETLLGDALGAYGKVVPDPPPPPPGSKDYEIKKYQQEFKKGLDKWERGLRDALLDAMVLKRLSGKKKEKVNDRHKLNVRAAKALRRIPGSSTAIMRAFERHYIKIKGYTVDPGIFDAVFDTLVKLGDKRTFLWLRDEVLNEDPRTAYRQRAEAALRAMIAFPHRPGRVRNETVKILIKTFEFIERQADFDGHGDAQALSNRTHTARAKKEYWKTVGPLAKRALDHFCTDPITKKPPVDYKRKKRLKLVADYARWYGRNKRLGRSPWKDPKGQ